MQCFLIPIVFLVVLAIVVPAPCAGESQRLFRIGTGGTAGVYYPIGKLIAQGFNEASGKAGAPQTGTPGTPALVAVAQSSGGSVANVQALASGEIEAGLVQADVAAWAFHGDRVFSGDDSVKVVRAVAGLYSEKLQIVTRRDANIRSVADLRGKRISIDEVGSGTLMAMRIVLDAHGLSENDLIPMYLKPEFTDDKIVTGELQGFVVMAGTPMKAADRLAGMELFFVRDPYGAELYRMNTVFKATSVAFTFLAVTTPVLLGWLRRRRPGVAVAGAALVMLLLITV